MPALRRLGPTEMARISLMPPAWRDIATGVRAVEDLSDDELLGGYIIDPKSGRRCPRPSWYPQNFLDEQIRRSLDWAADEIRSGAREAINVFRSIMTDGTAADSDRLRAATFFTDRFLGKDVQRVIVASEDPVESLFRSILQDPAGLAPHEPTAEERGMLA